MGCHLRTVKDLEMGVNHFIDLILNIEFFIYHIGGKMVGFIALFCR